MKKFRIAAVAMGLASALVLAGCAGAADPEGGEQEAKPVKINMAISGALASLPYLPSILAQELGFYEEEGLEVKFESVAGGSGAATALASGSVDVVTGYFEHTIQLQAKGQEMVFFAKMLDSPSLVLAVSPKTKMTINSVADLKGANVGVSSPGGGTDILLKYLLNKAGVAAEDVPVVSIGLGAEAVSAMEQGSIDAAVMLDPALTILQDRIGGESNLKILVDLRKSDEVSKVFGQPVLPSVGLYTMARWLEENPEAAKAVVRATTKALKWIAEHSAEEIVAAVPADMAGGEPEGYLKALAVTHDNYSTTPEIDPGGVEAILGMLELALPGVAKADIDLTKTFTNDYITK